MTINTTVTMNTTKRALVRSAFAAAALLLMGNAPALAQQGPGVTDKEIKLGTWIPLTGPFAAYGVPYRAGLDAYINMVNDKGGIKGRKITLVVEDNAYNPQRTVAAARKLISRDEVLAIAMPFGNVSASAFEYVLSEAKVPMINPWGSSLDWYTPAKDNLFGVMALYEGQARTIGRWAAKDGYKNVVVVHSALAAFGNVAEQVLPGAKSQSADGKVELLPVKLGTTDFSPLALEMGKKNADAVVLIMPQAEVIAAVKELRQQNYKGALYTYSPSVSTSVLELGGPALEGVKAIGLTAAITSDTPAIREYRAALAKYSPGEKPDYTSLIAWALAKTTVEAINRVDGPINRQSLVKSLYAMKNYDNGIFPPVSYAPGRHLGVTQVQRVVSKGGQWVNVGTPVESDKDW